MVKIFTSEVNRPKRRGKAFSSIFGSFNNGINKGCLLQRKESISTKEKSLLKTFFFFFFNVSVVVGIASQPANMHLQASSVWAICKNHLLSLSP